MGSLATAYAIGMARAVTGRAKILKASIFPQFVQCLLSAPKQPSHHRVLDVGL
jgi:hypothetical protein